MVLCGGERGAKSLIEVVHDGGLLGIHQVEFPYKYNEMCEKCVQVSVQVHGHCLPVVGPVDVSQHVEEIPADLFHQRLKGIGELLTCGRQITIIRIDELQGRTALMNSKD